MEQSFTFFFFFQQAQLITLIPVLDKVIIRGIRSRAIILIIWLYNFCKSKSWARKRAGDTVINSKEPITRPHPNLSHPVMRKKLEIEELRLVWSLIRT